MTYVNDWLFAHNNSMISEILRVKIPGNYNTGIVFLMIAILLAFNLYQDHVNDKL